MTRKLKVVVTDYIEDDLAWEAGELAKAGIEFEACQLKFKPEEEVLARIGDADILVVNMVKMTDSLLSKLTNCRLIIRHGVGYDNVDVAACTRHGIPFAYQPDYCRHDVAEHAIALIMACARKLVRSRRTLEESSARGQWDFSALFPIHRMAGKTLGILGVGRIGSLVALKLRSFGFAIVGCDPYLSAARRKQLGLRFVDLETLFKISDFLTVHTPLTDETRHIVNARTLALMKPTAYLINSSRGPMVDADALVEAVKAGRLAGAAIDVFDKEPPAPDHPLFALENVILTPHIGWASAEAGWEIRQSILDDILAAAKGKPARCVVNPETIRKKARSRS
jgi:D-3-phosphoglycerate dehydrogenase / 2-oxoglutarate reductase